MVVLSKHCCRANTAAGSAWWFSPASILVLNAEISAPVVVSFPFVKDIDVRIRCSAPPLVASSSCGNHYFGITGIPKWQQTRIAAVCPLNAGRLSSLLGPFDVRQPGMTAMIKATPIIIAAMAATAGTRGANSELAAFRAAAV